MKKRKETETGQSDDDNEVGCELEAPSPFFTD